MFWRFLYPREYLPRAMDLNLDKLAELGIKGLILDLDNTLLPWGGDFLPPEVKDWLEKLLNRGFRLCIVSNNGSGRIKKLLGPLPIPFVPDAIKPRKKSFLKALSLLGTQPEETAVVGDQIFTDILGGNRLGLYTILVTPVAKREFPGTKILRAMEKPVLARLMKKGIIKTS